MKKLLVFTPLMLVLLISLIAVSVTPVDDGIKACGVNRNIGTLTLYQKDPITWERVPGGGWGTMVYNLAGARFNITFAGMSLQPNTNYSLIYYIDAVSAPGSPELPGVLIASGKTGPRGNLFLTASLSLQQNLPFAIDANSQPDANGNIYGAKIFLVLSSDYDAGSNLVTGWHMNQWMFPLNGIFCNYTPR